MKNKRDAARARIKHPRAAGEAAKNRAPTGLRTTKPHAEKPRGGKKTKTAVLHASTALLKKAESAKRRSYRRCASACCCSSSACGSSSHSFRIVDPFIISSPSRICTTIARPCRELGRCFNHIWTTRGRRSRALRSRRRLGHAHRAAAVVERTGTARARTVYRRAQQPAERSRSGPSSSSGSARGPPPSCS